MKKKDHQNSPSQEDSLLTPKKEPLQEPALSKAALTRKKKLPGWVILPILGALLLVFALLSQFLKPAKAPATLSVIPVGRGDVKEEYTVTGTVESNLTKTFYSPVNAPVDTCNAVVGQSVKEGDLLISFDTSQLEQNNRQSQLNLEAAKAGNQSTREQADTSAALAAKSQAELEQRMENTRKKIRDKQEEVDELSFKADQEAAELQSAASNLENAVLQKSQELQEQSALLDNAKASLDENTAKKNTLHAELNICLSKLEHPSDSDLQETAEVLTARAEQLYSEIAALDNDRIGLQNAYDKISEKYDGLKNDLASLLAQSSGSLSGGSAAQELLSAKAELESLKASLEQLESSSPTPSSKLTAGQQKNMEIQENLAELSRLSAQQLEDLGKNGIHASFSGIISDVKTASGTAAMQGSELFTLVSNSDVSVHLEIPSGDFDKLKTGNKASVKIGTSVYQGTLTSVDKIATTNQKGNPVIGAKVHIDNPDENIYIGVSAKVTLSVAEANQVLCLSNETVNTGTEGDFVYVIQDGIVKKQTVELGIASDSMVEIKSGLKDGDEVIADVTSTLEEGMAAIGVPAAD